MSGMPFTATGHAGLLALGSYRPARQVLNTELEVETTDEWVRERTGIRSRRIAGPEESVVAMAVAAGGKALADAGLVPEALDLVLLATCSMPTPIPGGSAQVATTLGAHRAGVADVNGGCAGFCYALALAADSVRAGSVRTVLVVGSERLSDWTDWSDRSTCILFGDGAGAAVVAPTSTSSIGPVVWGGDGARAGLVAVPPGGHGMRMDGPPLFRWAITALPQVARDACAAAGLSVEQLDGFVCHQANLRIVEGVVRALRLPESVVVARDIVDTGNTSAASIPLALDALREGGRLPSGAAVLLLGFGAGLSYAAQVVRLP
jgi:3-oxoacyl-[acyl-carrier-protein] synthase-3